MLAAVRKATAGAAVLKTISYSLNPDYRYHPGGGEPTLEGYTAANVVQVTLDDLAKIGSVIDSATQAGANHIQGIQFTLRDQDAVRAEALREAATRARAEADVLAAALGAEGGARAERRGEQPARRAAAGVRSDSACGVDAAGAVPTPVEAGTLDVTADVTLSVEVSPAAR